MNFKFKFWFLRQIFIDKKSNESIWKLFTFENIRIGAQLFFMKFSEKVKFFQDGHKTSKFIKIILMYLTTYRKKNNLEKCAGMGLNGFHMKWIIVTHCNWKKPKSWERFGSYQLNSTAHLAQFWGKWAGLAVLFSW